MLIMDWFRYQLTSKAEISVSFHKWNYRIRTVLILTLCVNSLQSSREGHNFFLILSLISDDSASINQLARTGCQTLVVWAKLWCSLTPSGVRWDGPGLPRPLHRDGGDVARVGRHRPQLRRPLQPVRQPDGATRQPGAEGKVHDQGRLRSTLTGWGGCAARGELTVHSVAVAAAPDGGTRGRAGNERTQLGLRRRLHEAPSQEGRWVVCFTGWWLFRVDRNTERY